MQNEKQTGLDEDLKLLKDVEQKNNSDADAKSWKERMAIIYRSEKKQILHSQLEIITYLLNMTNNALSMKELMASGSLNIAQCQRRFKEDYLTLMDTEKT